MSVEDRNCLSLTAQAIAAWVDCHRDVLTGLIALRGLGADAEEAVEAVLAVRELRVLRYSVGLFDALARGDGVEPSALLRTASSAVLVRGLEAALFGRDLHMVPTR